MRKKATAFVIFAASALAACTAATGGSGSAPAAPSGSTAVATLASVSQKLVVDGTATWTVTANGLDLRVHVAGCTLSREYPVAILENMDCASAVTRAQVWDTTRGGGIPHMGCDGGGGRLFYTRPNTDSKPWTVAGPDASNLLGHVMIVQDPDTQQPLACGQIIQGQPVAQPEAGVATGPEAHPELRAQLAGFCVSRLIASKVPGCPDPAKFAECASSHCPLDSCVKTCSDYLACLAPLPDACDAAASCPMSAACMECSTNVTNCSVGPCASTMFACNTPTPGGPCSKVEECCMLQGPRASFCLNTVRMASGFGGDVTCVGLMGDWDFNTNVAFDPPCPFYDAGTGM